MNLLKIIITVTLFCVIISCTKDSTDEISHYEEITIGKTDYKNSRYIDYSPDLVIHVKADMNDSTFQQSFDYYLYEFGAANTIELQLNSHCDLVGGYWSKELVLYAVEDNICVTDTNDSHVKFLNYGDAVSLNSNWGRNSARYFEPANWDYEFEDDSVIYSRNANVRNKYLCFKHQINGIETFQWIQISTYNLDSVVIHDAFSTY
jgi:hypothetical protein